MSEIEPCVSCANRSICGKEEMACWAFLGYTLKSDYYEEDKVNPSTYLFDTIFNHESNDSIVWMYNGYLKQKRKVAHSV